MAKVNFGIKTVKYQLGDSGKEIEFVPSDAFFPERLEKSRADIQDYTSKIVQVEGIENQFAQIREVDKYIRDKIDEAFGYAVCDTVFGICSCLSLNENGEYFFECFFNAILPAVEKEFGIRVNKLNSRVKAYTNKKGMHPVPKK